MKSTIDLPHVCLVGVCTIGSSRRVHYQRVVIIGLGGVLSVRVWWSQNDRCDILIGIKFTWCFS